MITFFFLANVKYTSKKKKHKIFYLKKKNLSVI